MASYPWELWVWQRASDLLQQAERVQRNFLQIAAGANIHGSLGRTTWSPPVNLVETDGAVWVICAVPGVDSREMQVRLEGQELVIRGRRALPQCCAEGELKTWEIPLGYFERRLRLSPGTFFSVGETRLENGLLFIELRKLP